MKIKMLQSIAGADFSLSPNDVTERFTASEAVRLIERGFAVPVSEVAVETAALEVAPEKRAKRKK